MISREFKLYLNAGVGVAPVINANQFDRDEEWIFTLLQSDGTVYTPSTGTIIGLKQDGTTILNAGTVNSSGQVVITETEQITAVPGSNLFEILIDGNTHGTANFVVFVERRPGDIDNPSESDISLFQEAIEAAGNVTQFQADISALQSGLATTNANLTSEANTRASADATLQSNISAEASTRSTQDAVLQAEIDQLIAPTGEAPSAAEVQNARIGVDGTTYDTLGDAVRGQYSDLKSQIKELNYFDSHSATEGYTRVKDGVFSPTTGYYDSNLIRCYPESDFCIIIEKKKYSQSLPQEPLQINFFDEDGNWVSGSANYTNIATEIPSESSVFGYGGWIYKFTTPTNKRIAYWSNYYSSSRWNGFALWCFYVTNDGNYKFKGSTPLSAIYQDKQIPMGWIDGLAEEFENVVADTTMSIKVQSLYSDWSEFDTGYLDTSGQVVAYENTYLSDYVAITPGSQVSYELRIIGNSMLGLAWYDDGKNFIDGVGHSGGKGQWHTETGTVTLPTTARYIRFGGRKYNGSAEKAQFVTYYTNEKIKDYLTEVSETNPWAGKNWVAFGTSITDTSNSLGEGGTPTGKYVPCLQKLSGMSVINKGIAGGNIGVVPGVTTGQIMTAIKSADNLAAIQAADIITIEGFVNDFVANLPIGEISDTTNSTLMGALYEAVTYLYSQNEDATIVLLTESTGQYIDSSHWFPVTRANTLGKYQYEYNDAIITMAKYLGCHVIDCGQKSQINQWHPDYLADWIHHSELGGKQYAETIWDELKSIHSNSNVSVS